jgi:hypothetical protein
MNTEKSNGSDSKYEMIGPDMDEIMDGISFINENYVLVRIVVININILKELNEIF